MAKLMLIGKVADVELTCDDNGEEDIWLATCVNHPAPDGWMRTPECTWTERYDTLNDAANYATDHADGGEGG